MTRRRILLFACMLLGGTILLLAAVASPGGLSSTDHHSVLLRGAPHVQQRPDFCGEACAEMALRRLGYAISQDDVFSATGIDPALGRGAFTRELARGLEALGFDVGKVWHTIHRSRAAAQLEQQFRHVHADLAAGIPSIVCMRYDGRPDTTEHFRLVLGYDRSTDEVIYHEPAEPGGAYKRMGRKQLFALWPLKYTPNRWTLIRIPLRPVDIVPPPRSGSGFSKADYAQHVRQLKRRLRRKLPRTHFMFTVVVQPPFVVVGDQAPSMVRRQARGTVKWAVDLLKKGFFKGDPLQILDIYLFKNKSSYESNTRRLFGQNPSTPYGFYSDHHRALVMNIATGGGTLVHEIVHPFMEANFPACPPWFNEGLGSLFEQSGKRGGKIVGFTNWRLAGLQRAIRTRSVPSFRRLLAQSVNQFYNMDPGTNYSQSRYLLYYLQEKGLLRAYYRTFVRNQRHDPTGYATLKQILEESDMAAFQRRWEAYVLGLTYP